LESIGREMVSTLDPDALFESILDSAMNATGAHIGHLAIMDPSGQTLRLAAGRGYQGLPQGEPGGTVPNSAFGLSTKAIQDGHVLMVQDVRRSPEHVDWTGGRGRSLLAVPIARLGRPLGVITVESEETAAFGDEQARFLTQVASYAAVAITNAGLYQQLEDNLREQSLLYQASAQIATSMDTQAVAMAVADSLAVALGAVNVTVFAPDPLKDGFAVLATAANGQVAGGEASEVAEADELSACLDRGMPLHFERTVNGDHRSAMAIPLSVGAEPIGVVEIQQDAPHAFGEAELRTAQTIAAQAAIALQNSDLFRRIQESHDRLSAVLNSTKEAILLVDRGGDVRLTNRQFETMLSEQEAQLVGAPLLAGPGELAEKLGFPSQAGQSPDSILNDAVDPVDLHIDTPKERVLRRSVQPVQEADGEPIGWLVVLRDITEEQELAEAREQLTEMIVHDLRSPLTTILGSLSLIEREIPETDRPQVTSQALNVSRRSVDQMLGLVNSLLDLARLEASPLELELAPLAIDQLVGELSESFVPEANQAGLILDVAVGTSIPTVEADRDKVRRVLGNLLDNAIKFTPEGGRIEIGIQAHDGLVQVKVTDSGPGVPADMRERIFDRFAQVPGRTGRRRGTGLGLAFAKLAIEAHGGRIWVEDNHPSGSAFCVELPIDQDETALTKDR
jgi:NtrC-family two-component system sensor histidine kinase KinB